MDKADETRMWQKLEDLAVGMGKLVTTATTNMASLSTLDSKLDHLTQYGCFRGSMHEEMVRKVETLDTRMNTELEAVGLAVSDRFVKLNDRVVALEKLVWGAAAVASFVGLVIGSVVSWLLSRIGTGHHA